MLTVKNALWVLFCLYLLLPNGSNALDNTPDKNQYLLQKIAQAPQNTSKKWIQLIESPRENNYYYVANRQGQIYQLEQDKPNNNSLLLDLQALATEKTILQLTAFALHPNFALQDQDGYGTFYTAHVENRISNNTKRLHDPKIKELMPYDAVVSEWQFNARNPINSQRPREIFKIAIPKIQSAINQLSFNPYSKSWHDNFSQLYITLAQSPQLKQYPLYSGAILRINPQKISTASYSVPHGNPYYANAHIEESIYLFGAGQIKQFIWPDKYSNKLLISHQYRFNNILRHWLSYSNGGEDWRSISPKEFIYQSENALSAHSILVYRGQNTPALRHKLLLLTQSSQQWKLSSITKDITDLNAGITPQQQALSSPYLEWKLQQKLPLGLQLGIYRDSHDELLFFNKDNGAIYQLFQQNITTDQQIAQESTLPGILFFIVVLLILFTGYFFYQVTIQHKSAKALVRREFSSLSFSNEKRELHLFKRHQHEADKIIPLADIKQCQLLLGDLAIATINPTLGYGFDDQQDSAVREVFYIEHIAKMIDHRVRRISLVIKTSEKNSLIICLYLRKGSDRITKKSYYEVVEDVIDWCWLISAQINTKHTGERTSKPTVTAADIAQAEHKVHDDTPLHKQAAIIRPATHPQPSIDAELIALSQCAEIQTSEKNDNNITQETQNDNVTLESAKVETDLVNALEKLVKLQQQGFLSADEFSLAKAKLLDSLNKTE